MEFYLVVYIVGNVSVVVTVKVAFYYLFVIQNLQKLVVVLFRYKYAIFVEYYNFYEIDKILLY